MDEQEKRPKEPRYVPLHSRETGRIVPVQSSEKKETKYVPLVSRETGRYVPLKSKGTGKIVPAVIKCGPTVPAVLTYLRRGLWTGYNTYINIYYSAVSRAGKREQKGTIQFLSGRFSRVYTLECTFPPANIPKHISFCDPNKSPTPYEHAEIWGDGPWDFDIECFDDVSLHMDDGCAIHVDHVTIVLNDVRILDQDYDSTVIFGYPLFFRGDIRKKRNLLEHVDTDGHTTSSYVDVMKNRTLYNAAGDLGQGWSTKYPGYVFAGNCYQFAAWAITCGTRIDGCSTDELENFFTNNNLRIRPVGDNPVQ